MTHVFLDPEAVDWTLFLQQQQTGGGAGHYFKGEKYMRGFGGTYRSILRSIGNIVEPVAKNLALSAGAEGINAGAEILRNVGSGEKTFSEALKEQGTKSAKRLGDRLQQCGQGRSRGKKLQRGRKKRTISTFPPVSKEITSVENIEAVPAGLLTKPKRKRRPDQLDLVF